MERLMILSGHSRSFSLLSHRRLSLSTPLSSSLGNGPAAKERVWIPRQGRHQVSLTRASAFDGVLPSTTPTPPTSFDSTSPSSPTLPLKTPAPSPGLLSSIEQFIEQVIFNCRFFTFMAVMGSLAGSVLCFLKGCGLVYESFAEYFYVCMKGLSTGRVILLLVEAIDVYLIGTVMLIFGMGVYELFISSLEVSGGSHNDSLSRSSVFGSSLFGLFRMRERPKWLEIHSLDELKTKLGHVIVMILLVGMFDKSKKVPINSGADLLCLSTSILLSAGSLFLLSKLHTSK